MLAGGKEGIFYNIDRANMGKRSHTALMQPDFVGTFTPIAPFNYLADTNQATTTDGATGSHGGDRTFIPNPADGGRTRHFHGGPIYFEHGTDRLVFVMGENVWREEQEWPPARTQYVNYYLHSGGDANSSSGDGSLSTEKPGDERPDHFLYDPFPRDGGGQYMTSMSDRFWTLFETDDNRWKWVMLICKTSPPPN